jgi:lactoylglutathione lyase
VTVSGVMDSPNRKKTLHTGLRVTSLDESMAFYTALGYEVVGVVPLENEANLTVLKFPSEPVGTLELVHRPSDGAVSLGTGFSRLVVQVESLTDACHDLVAACLDPEPQQRPGGPNGPRTSWLTDPDGYRIELVQWTPGHADGISAADFA